MAPCRSDTLGIQQRRSVFARPTAFKSYAPRRCGKHGEHRRFVESLKINRARVIFLPQSPHAGESTESRSAVKGDDFADGRAAFEHGRPFSLDNPIDARVLVRGA